MGQTCSVKRAITLPRLHSFVSEIEELYIKWQKGDSTIESAKNDIIVLFTAVTPFLVNQQNFTCTAGFPPQVFEGLYRLMIYQLYQINNLIKI